MVRVVTSPDDLAESSAQLARLVTLRAVNEYVEKFHVSAGDVDTAEEMASLLTNFHSQILRTVRLRSSSEQERVEAHVLRAGDDLVLSTYLAPTDEGHEPFVPTMSLVVDAEHGLIPPGPGAGVATYCLYRSLTGAPGVALVHDVTSSTDVIYYRLKPPCSYLIEPEADVYKRAGDAPPPYRSLMCTAIPRVVASGPAPDAPSLVERRHALSITSTLPAAFSVHDCAWIEGVASLLGSLYGSHEVCADGLTRKRSSKKGGKRHAPPRG